MSDALYPGLSMYVPNFDEVQRQYDEEVAQVAPDSDAAAVALLRLASVYVDIGYPLIVAPRLVCIEEPEYPSDASEVSMQRLQKLQDAGVREGHLESPADRALWCLWQVAWPDHTMRDRVYSEGLVEREAMLDAAAVLVEAIEYLQSNGQGGSCPGLGN